MLTLTGARVFDGEAFRDDVALVIEGPRIAAITSYRDRPREGEARDLGGGVLAPGFVDVQVNGGGGALFNADPTPETVAAIAAAHRRFGSVGVMPTLITDAPELIARAIWAVREARKTTPSVLGLHLEGPFLDARRKGAHEARFLREMTPGDVEEIASADCGAVMVTLAPNRTPLDRIAALSGRGVLVSLGHADATCAEARAALDAGASAFTHLFNAMSPLTAREPGMVGAALADRNAYAGIIADGHHVHPSALQAAFAAKGRDRLMLVTDAMAPAAGGPDRFQLQGRWVTRSDGALRLDDGALAGSALTMDAAVRFCVETLGLPLADALIMASRTPAAFLRRERDLGRLAPGYLASLVHLGDRLEARETWVEGRGVD